jgi:hypothetical protein
MIQISELRTFIQVSSENALRYAALQMLHKHHHAPYRQYLLSIYTIAPLIGSSSSNQHHTSQSALH